jgi:hypothetical protein
VPYVTLAQVKAAAPQLKFSGTSRPTEVEVADIITRIEAELDGVISSLGFETPVTGTVSLMIVKQMILDEVISQAIVQQTVGVVDPNNFGAKTLHDRYKEKIKALLDPNDPFTLPDAIKLDVQEKLLGETGSIAAEIGVRDEDYRMTRNERF